MDVHQYLKLAIPCKHIAVRLFLSLESRPVKVFLVNVNISLLSYAIVHFYWRINFLSCLTKPDGVSRFTSSHVMETEIWWNVCRHQNAPMRINTILYIHYKIIGYRPA